MSTLKNNDPEKQVSELIEIMRDSLEEFTEHLQDHATAGQDVSANEHKFRDLQARFQKLSTTTKPQTVRELHSWSIEFNELVRQTMPLLTLLANSSHGVSASLRKRSERASEETSE
jgi:hypothetical protein